MNRFRTKKKNREGAETPTGSRTWNDSDVQPTLKPTKTFRLGKKQVEQPKKEEVDLTKALPSEDDFRTSLLMSGLSARFSMLREQDDPNTKIGKASDDSVLFPKRQSRMNDFGFNRSGLFDIAEVASIKSSIRPPFADDNRKNSFGSARDSYATDEDWNGSVMNRPRPSEGNNLFGGRQKVYKIPSHGASSKNLAEGDTGGMLGRQLYEDDVSQSSFQKLREKERLERLERMASEEDAEDNSQSRPTSPASANYNRKRETSSTTSSGPFNTRSSTAATSITSQRTPSLSGGQGIITPATSQSSTPVLERSMTKNRRLWESATEQHMHEQQAAALQRFDTISKQRSFDTRTPSSGQSSPNIVANMTERFERPHILSKGSTPNLRAASPPPAASLYSSFDFSRDSDSKNFAAPLSPPMSESEENAAPLPIQPNDRGKATALGTFQKPVQPYDENKFMQRQLQLQQGRETPPLRKNSTPQPFVPPPLASARNRSESNATTTGTRSRSGSVAQHRPVPPPITDERKDLRQETVPEEHQIAAGTFLSSPNPSSADSEDFTSPRMPQIRPFFPPSHPQARNDESEHPTNRKQLPRMWADYTVEPEQKPTPEISVSTIETVEPEAPAPGPTAGPGPDSPTLGPIGVNGLSGMVRQHLRSDSGASSIYAAPSPGLTSRFPARPPSPPNAIRESAYSGKNPWELEDWVQDYRREADQKENMDDFGAAGLGLSNANGLHNDASRPSVDEDSSHRREMSGDSQKDFVNTLASRRKQVQENLKSFVEADAGANPTYIPEWQKDLNSMKPTPLGILRNKTSRPTITPKGPENNQSKAMKMLGLSAGPPHPATSPNRPSEDLWAKEEEEMLRPLTKASRPPPQVRNVRQARRDAQRDREREVFARHAGSPNPNEYVSQGMRSSPVRAPPPAPVMAPGPPHGPYARRPSSPPRMQAPTEIHPAHRIPQQAEHRSPSRAPSEDSKHSTSSGRSESRPPSRTTRDRSSSGASTSRSKSRNGRYHDDRIPPSGPLSGRPSLDSNGMPARSPGVPSVPYQRSPAMPSPNPGNRSRANSRSTAPGYFDGHIQVPQPDRMDIGMSPRPSPVTPFSANSTPPLALPSPAGSATPTPTVPGFQNRQPPRKKVINKADISEPTLVSSTSRITTIDLPPGSSLSNGSESAPPVPPINPRRRNKTGTMFSVFSSKSSDHIPSSSPPLPNHEDISMFSDDDDKPRRQRLRKSSSEGGNLNARARQIASAMPSPALPGMHPAGAANPIPTEGGMF